MIGIPGPCKRDPGILNDGRQRLSSLAVARIALYPVRVEVAEDVRDLNRMRRSEASPKGWGLMREEVHPSVPGTMVALGLGESDHRHSEDDVAHDRHREVAGALAWLGTDVGVDDLVPPVPYDMGQNALKRTRARPTENRRVQTPEPCLVASCACQQGDVPRATGADCVQRGFGQDISINDRSEDRVASELVLLEEAGLGLQQRPHRH